MNPARSALRVLLLLVLISINVFPSVADGRDARELGTVAYKDLPVEAQQTLALIRAGGPFPFDKDGTVFSNRERVLPLKPRGYYHEYTVVTPGARNRGTRRIIAGRPSEYYYTADHYETFGLIVGAP